jgi:hypothetical protein
MLRNGLACWIVMMGTLLCVMGCGDDSGGDPDGAIDGAVDGRADAVPEAGIPWNPPDWSLCMATSECAIVAATCCGVCSAPTVVDVTGVNQSQRSVQRREVCGDPPPACPECASMNNPNLVATCRDVGFPGGNMCIVEDLAESTITECESDEDCVLRSPTCCPSCTDLGQSGYIAINPASETALQGLLCDETPLGCDECAPVFSEGSRAVCLPATGSGPRHCGVAFVTM